jgi:phosphoribosylformimino-5-aminoimidazole carboxamide ribotide isomerase
MVIPAIDLRGGRCVRLKQGELTRETVYSDDPAAMARKWSSLGAERLHVVDLDGAVQGRPVNTEVVLRIVEAAGLPVQVGGGVRGMEAVRAYLEGGVDQVILGTSAIRDPAFLENACGAFPNRIILGLDARGDRVAVQGWTEETAVTPLEIARRCEHLALFAIIYTDIHRDGMSTGPNLEATLALARAVRTPIIASGGISGAGDVSAVSRLEPDGVIGMITGRALYQGTLELPEAIRIASSSSNALK